MPGNAAPERVRDKPLSFIIRKTCNFTKWFYQLLDRCDGMLKLLSTQYEKTCFKCLNLGALLSFACVKDKTVRNSYLCLSFEKDCTSSVLKLVVKATSEDALCLLSYRVRCGEEKSHWKHLRGIDRGKPQEINRQKQIVMKEKSHYSSLAQNISVRIWSVIWSCCTMTLMNTINIKDPFSLCLHRVAFLVSSFSAVWLLPCWLFNEKIYSAEH